MAANRLGEDDRQAMAWVQQNTPAASSFIILSGETQLMRDPVQEWFPALAERRSQTTLQGWEWLSGEKFNHAIAGNQGLINCLQQDLACLTTQAQKLGMSYDQLYIKKGSTSTPGYYSGQALIAELAGTPGYQKIFENKEVVIFKRE